jgi:acyl-coenzyme A synthetase/AMP-(fatty) acid ligase
VPAQAYVAGVPDERLSADELPKTSTGKVQKYLLVRDRAGS